MCSAHPLLRFSTLAFALLLALPSPWAFAKGPGESEVARTERAKGTVALNLGQYEEAITHFSQAYALTQDAILLFSLAQAYRLAGKPDKAVSSYSSFLRAAGPGTKYRTQFERAAAEIETITPTLVCPPRERAGTGKQPGQQTQDDKQDEKQDEKQLDELMNAPGPLAKTAPTPKPVEPPPAEEAIEPPPVAKAPAPALAPLAPAAQAPALTLTAQTAPPAEPTSTPLYKKVWFWSAVAGVLAVGGVATWYFTRPQNQVPASTYGSTTVLP
ncbi:MAG TPA: tetratricopeptide repeat protein [Polyangia bacterium]